MESALVRVDITALEMLPIGADVDPAERLSRCASSCIETCKASVGPQNRSPNPADV